LNARLYLDHAATTPVLPEAREAMVRALAIWANPSSPHGEGRAARAMVEDARRRVADALAWPHSVIFTSGATEALALALASAVPARRVISPVEHDAVVRAARSAEVLMLDSSAHVVLDDDGCGDALVTIQSVNNETGVMQPLDRLGATIRAGGGLLLADCAQSAGKLPLPDADMIAVSAHKLGGPPGVGALLVRDLASLNAGGGQELGYRGGTENLPAIMGFAAALEARLDWTARAAALRAELEAALVSAGAEVVGGNVTRLPTIGAYRMPGVAATTQLIRLDLAGISVSAGSACASGSMKPSHVLAAMGLPEGEAREVIRVSFSPGTSSADVGRFADAWRSIARNAGLARA
jgi:cysteine desulfurase